MSLSSSSRFRIGVDIGGTFTDFVLHDGETGQARTHKQLTTPYAPANAVISGVGALCKASGLRVGDIGQIIHGTTLVTNAIIERKGAKTAMLVTRGFRDSLDIALERRYDLFDLRILYPAPVIPRWLRIEVVERVKADGSVETPLELGDELRSKLAIAIEQDGVEAIAVCFLHSYCNDRHERRAAEWLRDHFPKLACSTSSAVLPFMREYERWTTTCLNAYVQPIVARYLAELEGGLAAIGFAGKSLIMNSSGGTLTSELAREFPIRLLESGPAAGALMAAQQGRSLGELQLLSFDMGGTTAKGCIINSGTPLKRYEIEVARMHEFRKGSGLPTKIPVIDMIEIGAGGGSIAAIDQRGALRVGPASAGAEPGPACYGRGGVRPTLTDANLVLGYLASDSFLGGRMALDAAAATIAIASGIAAPLGVDLERAAWGIHEVINEDVARAFRIHASERGIDYRNCSLVVFGGSGPLHGSRIARKLRISRILCPPGAGVMSAFGLLTSPIGFETVRSNRVLHSSLTATDFARMLDQLVQQANVFLLRAGVERANAQFSFKLDMRYEGQGYSVEVPLPSGMGAEAMLKALPELFAQRYCEIFGTDLGEREVEIVDWKVEALGPLPPRLDFDLKAVFASAARLKGRRPAYFPEAKGFHDCPVYSRYGLVPGDQIEGPAFIEENESTCVLPPGDRLQVDHRLNLVIEVGK
jgi:N-methylhydantoinase A